MLLRILLVAMFATSCVTYDSKVEEYDFAYKGESELSEKQEFNKFAEDDQACNNRAVAFAQARSGKDQNTNKFVNCMAEKGWSASLNKNVDNVAAPEADIEEEAPIK